MAAFHERGCSALEQRLLAALAGRATCEVSWSADAGSLALQLDGLAPSYYYAVVGAHRGGQPMLEIKFWVAGDWSSARWLIEQSMPTGQLAETVRCLVPINVVWCFAVAVDGPDGSALLCPGTIGSAIVGRTVLLPEQLAPTASSPGAMRPLLEAVATLVEETCRPSAPDWASRFRHAAGTIIPDRFGDGDVLSVEALNEIEHRLAVLQEVLHELKQKRESGHRM